jgi:hypothetical protein
MPVPYVRREFRANPGRAPQSGEPVTAHHRNSMPADDPHHDRSKVTLDRWLLCSTWARKRRRTSAGPSAYSEE